MYELEHLMKEANVVRIVKYQKLRRLDRMEEDRMPRKMLKMNCCVDDLRTIGVRDWRWLTQDQKLKLRKRYFVEQAKIHKGL